MTPELERIEELLRLSMEGDAWHGPSVLQALDGIGAEIAPEEDWRALGR